MRNQEIQAIKNLTKQNRTHSMKEIQSLLRSAQPLKWVFYGDSITMGALHTMGWRDYPELFAERIRFELRRNDDIVIKSAYDGNTTRHLLDSFDWRVKQFQPNVVFIMVGTNDCYEGPDGFRVGLEEYQDNLKLLIKKINTLKSCRAILQTSCPILRGGSPERERNFPEYMAAVRRIARENDIPLIDHLSYWLQKAREPGNAQFAWMSDAIHPNEMGHRVFAELIFKKLKIHSPGSTVCRLFYA